MPKRLTRVLVALIIALATILPAGARAMPTQAMAMQPGQMEADPAQPCQQCPDHRAGSDKMVLCPILVCAGPLVSLPAMTAVGVRGATKIAYPAAVPARVGGAAPAPDPFPPRPIVLL